MAAGVDTTGNSAAWQQYAAAAATTEAAELDRLPHHLEWTQVPSLGPGEEILEPLPGATVLELGCGTGRSAALLAARGAQVTAFDAAKAQIRGQERAVTESRAPQRPQQSTVLDEPVKVTGVTAGGDPPCWEPDGSAVGADSDLHEGVVR